MTQSTQPAEGQTHFLFKVPKSYREQFLKELAADLAPYQFLTMEEDAGEDVRILVIPASSEQKVKEKLAQLESKLNLTQRADHGAADRGDDIPI